MLDSVIRYLPSPLDVPAIKGLVFDGAQEGREVQREASDKEAFSSLAFKIATDPFVGTLTFFRVYSGVLKTGDMVLNPLKNKRERIGRILQMHSNSREEVKEVYAGDIAAAVGLKEVVTGDTLCDKSNPIVLENIDFPDPVISVAVEPKTTADQDKMSLALSKLAQEDPSFVVRVEEETGQTIISGMGELHLDIIVDRMKREFNVAANVGDPQVSYRECITAEAESEGKFIRESGGKSHYGHVNIKLEPLSEGSGYEFENVIVDGSIPEEFIPAINQGIQEQLQNGVLTGSPVVDLKVSLFGGSFHDVDSSEMSFKVAASMAIRDGVLNAAPKILEPVMKVEVIAPEDNMGDVMGDLNRRRGVVQGMDEAPSGKIIRAEVPLSKMFGYSTALRSASQGRANYSMEFAKYAEVPKSVAEVMIIER